MASRVKNAWYMRWWVDGGGGRDDEEATVEARRDEWTCRRQRGDHHEATQDLPQPDAARHRPLRTAEQSLQGHSHTH